MSLNIRNFSIIAHINHGKSTLADRFIQICDGLCDREMKEQVLDSMEIERERGITIKSQCVNLNYKYNNKNYKFNIIDTPGHIDFTYEVSRAMFACEGAILLVDASQSVEAQTLAHYNIAIGQGLKIIPVINKIDLENADIERTISDITNLFGYKPNEIYQISSKKNIGINNLIQKLINILPSPIGEVNSILKCLIIDSWFDQYVGVVVLIRVKEGIIKINDKILILSTKSTYIVNEIGYFTPKKKKVDFLMAGEIGYLIFGVKNISSFPVGDTITLDGYLKEKPLIGFKRIEPKVYAGIYPINKDCNKLRDALSKLSLNDSSLFYESEFSNALGYGFRCGFLGLLHLDIVKERIYREYDLDVLVTSPTVVFKVLTKLQNIIYIDCVSNMPSTNDILEIMEPIAIVNIIIPLEYVGAVMKLCFERRGYKKIIHYFNNQVLLEYYMPMIEIIYDFFDLLKSATRGFSSFEYKFDCFKKSNLVKVDILVNKVIMNEFSFIVHKDNAYKKSCYFLEKIKESINRQMYDINIQAAINSKIISKAVVKAFRKDVTSKCYGGDITRKKKLLKKQKIGKKKMKSLSGKLNIEKKVFLSIFNIKNK